MRPRRMPARNGRPAWALLGLTHLPATGAIAHALHGHGLGSIPVFTTDQLLLHLEHPPADDIAVVVLDGRLPAADSAPNGHGDVVHEIRDRSNAGIVVLTETPLPDTAVDLALPLDAPAEVVAASASILAATRRQSGANSRWGPLHLHMSTWEARWQTTPLRLTSQQFRLLGALVAAGGATVSVQQLAQTLYGHALDSDPDAVRAHIGRLRRRLREVSPAAADAVVTVRGQGYRIDSPEPWELEDHQL